MRWCVYCRIIVKAGAGRRSRSIFMLPKVQYTCRRWFCWYHRLLQARAFSTALLTFPFGFRERTVEESAANKRERDRKSIAFFRNCEIIKEKRRGNHGRIWSGAGDPEPVPKQPDAGRVLRWSRNGGPGPVRSQPAPGHRNGGLAGHGWPGKCDRVRNLRRADPEICIHADPGFWQIDKKRRKKAGNRVLFLKYGENKRFDTGHTRQNMLSFYR